MASGSAVELEVGDRTVRISNPDRVYFPARGETKLDLARYYIAVADGVVRALRDRPCMLHRFPTGVTGEKVHQKRLPRGAPRLGRDRAGALPALEPHRRRAVRAAPRRRRVGGADVDGRVPPVELPPRPTSRQPDEWRIDLDPMPQATYADVRRVAHVAHEVLAELGAVGWPKTSGGKGMHVYVRIEPRLGLRGRAAGGARVRAGGRAALRLVDLTWWRKDRDPASIFVDYNQNTRDHTIRCAYSVRGVAEALVSAPIRWDEVDDADPGDFTIATMPTRFAELGDLHAGIDDAVYTLDELLEWADRDATDDGAEELPELD